jgi:hypothetical protein
MVRCRTQKIPTMLPILSRTNPIHTPLPVEGFRRWRIPPRITGFWTLSSVRRPESERRRKCTNQTILASYITSKSSLAIAISGCNYFQVLLSSTPATCPSNLVFSHASVLITDLHIRKLRTESLASKYPHHRTFMKRLRLTFLPYGTDQVPLPEEAQIPLEHVPSGSTGGLKRRI